MQHMIKYSKIVNPTNAEYKNQFFILTNKI